MIMKRLILKLKYPWQKAGLFAVLTFILFWLLVVIGAAFGNNWELIRHNFGVYSAIYATLAALIFILTFLWFKYEIRFVVWSFVLLGILIFLASSRTGLASKVILDFLEKNFDVRMLASGIGVISFGFALFNLSRKSENRDPESSKIASTLNEGNSPSQEVSLNLPLSTEIKESRTELKPELKLLSIDVVLEEVRRKLDF
jgi:hypothetical protein